MQSASKEGQREEIKQSTITINEYKEHDILNEIKESDNDNEMEEESKTMTFSQVDEDAEELLAYKRMEALEAQLEALEQRSQQIQALTPFQILQSILPSTNTSSSSISTIPALLPPPPTTSTNHSTPKSESKSNTDNPELIIPPDSSFLTQGTQDADTELHSETLDEYTKKAQELSSAIDEWTLFDVEEIDAPVNVNTGEGFTMNKEEAVRMSEIDAMLDMIRGSDRTLPGKYRLKYLHPADNIHKKKKEKQNRCNPN